MAVKTTKTKTPPKTPAKDPAKAPAKTKARKPSKPAHDLNDLIFDIISDASAKVENTFFRSALIEDVSGFSSGSLTLDLLLGKIVPGLYIFSGKEQSSKTTVLAHLLGRALKNGAVMVKHYDVERAVRAGYIGKIIARESGIPWSELKPKQGEHRRYRWILESTLEKVFNEMEEFLSSLPDKTYVEEDKTWYLIFDRRPQYDNKGKVVKNPIYEASFKRFSDNRKPASRSTKDEVWFDIGDDSAPQMVYAIDSIKALTLRGLRQHTTSRNMPSLLAKALSDYLPYVKGLLRDKHCVALFINQMYDKPGVMYGSPDYETSGNALKLHSDVRCILKPLGIQKPFPRTEGESDYIEPSAIHKGGSDHYTFKGIRNIKNKFSDPNLRAVLRIWSTGPDIEPGIDPVFDTLEFLNMCGLASVESTRKCETRWQVSFTKNELLGDLSETEMLGMNFKKNILAEMGIIDGENNGIRRLCARLLKTGKASLLRRAKGVSGVNHLDGEVDDDED